MPKIVTDINPRWWQLPFWKSI